jgi:hypothetical protein
VKKVHFVIVWAIAFAYVEASVVEYLRALYYPIDSGGFRFPLLTLDELTALGSSHRTRLAIEFGRELATLAMLAGVGLLAANNRREAWAHFMIAFGVWDIFYYLWLKVFLDWPASLLTWDLLFLVPLPWVGPVLAPVLISLVMIGCGLVVLYYEGCGQPLATTLTDWIWLTLGGLVVIASFCMDYVNIMEGGLPGPFNWPVFATGLIVAFATFVRILRRNLTRRP